MPLQHDDDQARTTTPARSLGRTGADGPSSTISRHKLSSKFRPRFSSPASRPPAFLIAPSFAGSRLFIEWSGDGRGLLEQLARPQLLHADRWFSPPSLFFARARDISRSRQPSCERPDFCFITILPALPCTTMSPSREFLCSKQLERDAAAQPGRYFVLEDDDFARAVRFFSGWLRSGRPRFLLARSSLVRITFRSRPASREDFCRAFGARGAAPAQQGALGAFLHTATRVRPAQPWALRGGAHAFAVDATLEQEAGGRRASRDSAPSLPAQGKGAPTPSEDMEGFRGSPCWGF